MWYTCSYPVGPRWICSLRWDTTSNNQNQIEFEVVHYANSDELLGELEWAIYKIWQFNICHGTQTSRICHCLAKWPSSHEPHIDDHICWQIAAIFLVRSATMATQALYTDVKKLNIWCLWVLLIHGPNLKPPQPRCARFTICEQPALVCHGLQLHKPDVCHACINWSRLHFMPLSH